MCIKETKTWSIGWETKIHLLSLQFIFAINASIIDTFPGLHFLFKC